MHFVPDWYANVLSVVQDLRVTGLLKFHAAFSGIPPGQALEFRLCRVTLGRYELRFALEQRVKQLRNSHCDTELYDVAEMDLVSAFSFWRSFAGTIPAGNFSTGIG